MHTDTSLKVLDNVTVILTNRLRHFTDFICPAYATVETDGEYNAQYRAAQCKAAQATRKTASATSAELPAVNIGGKRSKSFNLHTYKFHSLPDNVPIIRLFGTTDSYSTQAGEFEHKVVKRRYAHTNRRNFIPQLVKKDVIENVHEHMAEELEQASKESDKRCGDFHAPAETETAKRERQQVADEGHVHHRIATDEMVRIHVRTWAECPEIQGDPAYKNFERELYRHLLARHHNVSGASDEPEYEESELDQVTLHNGFIYLHATTTFYYTTYDVCRTWDSINVNGSRRNVMLQANEDDTPSHPFWYARVLGVYHANVYYKGSPVAERIEFLYVRWFGIDPEWSGGAANRRLDRIGFVPDGEGAFGFLDPAHVIRPCHLIPAFHLGFTTRLLARSSARDATVGDYINWYVARFVDRDMMMRFLGWGIGHLNQADFPHEAEALIASDQDHQLQESEEKKTTGRVMKDVKLKSATRDLTVN
ncbi:hypothetical protein C8Q72DRAFT_881207 [Fomitopsis betulina]|nr:hypothetical protein C8Q72DRAFT_881207 [Fomitopsis betulina]